MTLAARAAGTLDGSHEVRWKREMKRGAHSPTRLKVVHIRERERPPACQDDVVQDPDAIIARAVPRLFVSSSSARDGSTLPLGC